MKKFIILCLAVLLLWGCSAKKENETVTEVSTQKKGWVWKEYTYSIRVDRHHSFIDLGNHKQIPDSEKRVIDDVWEHDLRLKLNNL